MIAVTLDDLKSRFDAFIADVHSLTFRPHTDTGERVLLAIMGCFTCRDKSEDLESRNHIDIHLVRASRVQDQLQPRDQAGSELWIIPSV